MYGIETTAIMIKLEIETGASTYWTEGVDPEEILCSRGLRSVISNLPKPRPSHLELHLSAIPTVECDGGILIEHNGMGTASFDGGKPRIVYSGLIDLCMSYFGNRPVYAYVAWNVES